jgi:23S rRNA (uracil1939-C5)-methyltransferase
LVRKGDRLELVCLLLDAEGAGLAEHEGVRVHVAGALPGEQVTVEVAHVSAHRPDAWGELRRLDSPSAARVAPACPAYGECGGCVLEHLAYGEQLAFKRDRVAHELLPRVSRVTVEECVASPRPLGYRNRSKLVYAAAPTIGAIAPKHGALAPKHGAVAPNVLGAYAPRSHRVVDLAGCRVAEEPLDAVAGALAALLATHHVRPYDERSAEGDLRYAILRVNHLGEVLATLVTAAPDWPAGPALARALIAERPEVVGVVHNVNASRGNALYGTEEHALAGKATLTDKVGSAFVHLSPTAFFQVNRGLAERLYADALAAAALTGTERVVDCYSGVGGLALTLAPRAGEVIGIEEHPAAVADAQASAQLNHATRTRFVCGDAAARLAELDAADVVVLNPPRKGCAPEVLAEVVRLAPRAVLYVSCAPDTLARDLALLDERGYFTEHVRPYDMLPQTPHIEALALITRR